MTQPEYGLIDFTRPGRRDAAIEYIAAMGEEGAALLAALFSGEAVNEHGIQFRDLTPCLICGAISARKMGDSAKRLTPYLNEILLTDYMGAGADAALTLGCIPDPSPETIHALTTVFAGENFAGIECAASMIRLEIIGHPDVRQATWDRLESCERDLMSANEV